MVKILRLMFASSCVLLSRTVEVHRRRGVVLSGAQLVKGIVDDREDGVKVRWYDCVQAKDVLHLAAPVWSAILKIRVYTRPLDVRGLPILTDTNPAGELLDTRVPRC